MRKLNSAVLFASIMSAFSNEGRNITTRLPVGKAARFARQSPEDRDRRLQAAQAKRDRKRARANGTGMCAA